MSIFEWKGRCWRIVPFLIITATLLFFVFWIGSMAYQYHLETEERRITLNKNISDEAKRLNSALHEENIKLKQENEHLKSVSYELIRDNGEKEYYNLFTHKLVKKIALDDSIYEYDKNGGFLLKKTDKYNNIYEYGTHGQLIKKTLPDGVWEQYNPVNEKLIKRKNIDGSIEEFDANEEKFKETDKNDKVKYFKTQIYQTIADFKKAEADLYDLKVRLGFTAKELKDAGYTAKELKAAGFTLKNLKDAGYTVEQLEGLGYSVAEFKNVGYTLFELINAGKMTYGGYTVEELKAAGFKDKVFRDNEFRDV